jgi:Fe-S cluster biogenesis protein NfuA
VSGLNGGYYNVGLKERVEEELVRLAPRLLELAKGEVELVSVDEETSIVTVRVFGGRLH